MKMLRMMAAPLMVLACYSAAAIAQTAPPPAPEPTVVTIPWGSIVSDVGPVLIGGAMGMVAWLVRKLPASIGQILMTQQANQLLERALTFGLNAVAGATKDKVLTVDVGNQVVAQALQYVTNHAPQWLIRWLGGQLAIEEKLISRLDLEQSAQVSYDKRGAISLVSHAPPASSPRP